MSLSPSRGQPEARLGRFEATPPPGTLCPLSAQALEALFELTSAVLSASPVGLVRTNTEAAMDYLAESGEFMRLLEYYVESRLGRGSNGAEDAPFEARMVDLMTTVQARLESARLQTSGV